MSYSNFRKINIAKIESELKFVQIRNYKTLRINKNNAFLDSIRAMRDEHAQEVYK